MASKKLTERQEMQKEAAREMSVFKRDDMIQKSRVELTVQEQRCVLYAISRIKPSDSVFQEYTFELKDFYSLCGIEDRSYTRLKQSLKKLADKSWWAEIDEKGTESVLRWFSVLRTNKKSGKVTVKFHEDMMPFLLQLAEQGVFYTQYNMRYILPMKCQYSPRLYEVLKSYEKNNRQWYFELEELKYVLNCQNYERWPDFRRRAIEPAVKEINEFSDLKIGWRPIKEGNKVVRIEFFMKKKGAEELLETKRHIRDQLDGQLNLEELLREAREENAFKAQFFKDDN